MKKVKGFTLIELMIAIVIIALIASVAYPSYREQVRDSRRADCEGALVSMAQAMERFYTVNNTYLGAAAGGGNTGAPTVFPASCPIDGGAATYTLTISAATASTYTVQAAPTGSQAGDECGTLTLTNTGVKGVTGGVATGVTWQDCW